MIRSVLIMTGVVLAFVADAQVTADGPAQPPRAMRCDAHGCYMPTAELQRLVAAAEAAEHYAKLCGWGGAK